MHMSIIKSRPGLMLIGVGTIHEREMEYKVSGTDLRERSRRINHKGASDATQWTHRIRDPRAPALTKLGCSEFTIWPLRALRNICVESENSQESFTMMVFSH